MGNHNYGTRNERGDRLLTFTRTNELFFTNLMFHKRKSKKWTWRSEDNVTKNEIDFIMVKKTQTASITNVEVIGNTFQYSSDHRMVRATMKIEVRKRIHNKKSTTIRVSQDEKIAKKFNTELEKNV